MKSIHKFLLNHGEAIGGLASIGFSVVAIWIALDANNAAEEAITMARQDFNSERSAILAVSVDNELKSVKIVPTDSNQVVLRTELIFPLDVRQISEDSYALSSYKSLSYPETLADISSYYDGLKFLLNETDRTKIRNFASGMYFSDAFPVIIQAHIIANNEKHTSSGLYEVDYAVEVSQDGRVTIKILSILFSKNLPDGMQHDDHLSYLSKIWSPRGFNAYKKYAAERLRDAGSYGGYEPIEISDEASDETSGDFVPVKTTKEESDNPATLPAAAAP